MNNEIGDQGQRYEIWYDLDKKPFHLGWSNDMNAFANVVKAHPAMDNYRRI